MPESKLAEPQNATPTPSADVYVVHGADPEVQAYAMAKYSRSALSMRDSLRDINSQKAEKFLNTFYFQYGHRSIADLAHLAMAIEKLSMLAAITVVDEQRWDGQERSTRYQQFRKSGYFVPDFGGDSQSESLFRETATFLFTEYEVLTEGAWRMLADRTPRPADMPQDAYERTLRARAFDVARYLLPLATYTSLGQIVNARTLETQIARLMSHPQPEVQRVGERLKNAARTPAFDVGGETVRKLVDEITAANPDLGGRAAEILLREVLPAPTLIKYAEANPYAIETRKALRQAAREIMGDAPIDKAQVVTLLDENEPIEGELATTLLYENSHYPYAQLRKHVDELGEKRRNEIVDLGVRSRGRHDELLRAYSGGYRFRFDILMDIGGFRDMHRHRRCIQILQDYTTAHGFETPQEIVNNEVEGRYNAAMKRAADTALALPDPLAAQYLIPMGYRCRSLFKMDFAEVLYISELRTTPAGHYSYRRVAWEMYRAVAERHPALAPHFRVTDIRKPVDILQR